MSRRSLTERAMRNLHLVGAPAAELPLVERGAEYAVLDSAVGRPRARRGGGPAAGGGGRGGGRGPARPPRGPPREAGAGLGKTALLDHAADLAADAGCLVRRAAPGPLERHFGFGVVRALLEAPLRERAEAPDGAAAAAGALLLAGVAPGAGATLPI